LAQNKRIEALRAEVDGCLALSPRISPPPAVGKIGRFPFEIVITQIRGKAEMVAQTHFWTVNSELYPVKHLVLLKGLPTAGHVSGQKIRLQHIMEITGTKQLLVVDGSTVTVFVFEPFIVVPSKEPGK